MNVFKRYRDNQWTSYQTVVVNPLLLLLMLLLMYVVWCLCRVSSTGRVGKA